MENPQDKKKKETIDLEQPDESVVFVLWLKMIMKYPGDDLAWEQILKAEKAKVDQWADSKAKKEKAENKD